jgi:hypothetical protein
VPAAVLTLKSSKVGSYQKEALSVFFSNGANRTCEWRTDFEIYFFLIPLSGHAVHLLAEGGCSPTKRILSHDMRSGGRTGQTLALPQTD